MRTLFGLALLLTPTIAAAQPGVTTAVAAATDPWAFHEGATFEANLGMGYAHTTFGSGQDALNINTDMAVAGAVGLGGWITPRLALGVRIAGLQIKQTVGGVTAPSTGFAFHAAAGPNLQYWFTPNIWMGGGVGLITEQWIGSETCSGNGCSSYGIGGNLRGGYSFESGGRPTFTISAEINPGYYWDYTPYGPNDLTTTAFSIFAGYQYL